MNELERASIALVDRPVSPPSPLEAIERRAGAIRRHRRLTALGAIALVVLLVAMGAVVRASHGGDSPDQAVFVGEGAGSPAAGEFPPPAVPGTTVLFFAADQPLDEAAAAPAVDALRARLQAQGLEPGQQVWIGPLGTRTTIAFRIPMVGRGDLAQIVEGVGRLSAIAFGGGSLLVAVPPQLRGAVVDDVSPTTVHVQLDPSTLVAVQATQCPNDAKCPTPDVSFPVTGPALATLTGVTADAATVVFADEVTARLWASILQNPLPDGITFSGSFSTQPDDEAVAPLVTTTMVIERATDQPNPEPATTDQIVCLVGVTDDADIDGSLSALQRRFEALGRQVDVARYVPGGGDSAGCPSGLPVTLTHAYDAADPSWVLDLAVLDAGIVRLPLVDHRLVHPVGATVGEAAWQGEQRTAVDVELTADDYAAAQSVMPVVLCMSSDPCWLTLDVDGTVVSNDLIADDARHTVTLVLPAADRDRGRRLAAVLANPFPDGASFRP